MKWILVLFTCLVVLSQVFSQKKVLVIYSEYGKAEIEKINEHRSMKQFTVYQNHDNGTVKQYYADKEYTIDFPSFNSAPLYVSVRPATLGAKFEKIIGWNYYYDLSSRTLREEYIDGQNIKKAGRIFYNMTPNESFYVKVVGLVETQEIYKSLVPWLPLDQRLPGKSRMKEVLKRNQDILIYHDLMGQ